MINFSGSQTTGISMFTIDLLNKTGSSIGLETDHITEIQIRIGMLQPMGRRTFFTFIPLFLTLFGLRFKILKYLYAYMIKQGPNV